MKKASNELIELFEYAIDKFNIAIEIPKEQLVEFSNQFVKKVITYEICMTIFDMLLQAIVIIGLYFLFKKAIKGYKILKDFYSSWLNNGIGKDKIINIKMITLTGSIVFGTITIVFVVKNIINLVMCFVFPEKILLAFIGNYI